MLTFFLEFGCTTDTTTSPSECPSLTTATTRLSTISTTQCHTTTTTNTPSTSISPTTTRLSTSPLSSSTATTATTTPSTTGTKPAIVKSKFLKRFSKAQTH